MVCSVPNSSLPLQRSAYFDYSKKHADQQKFRRHEVILDDIFELYSAFLPLSQFVRFSDISFFVSAHLHWGTATAESWI